MNKAVNEQYIDRVDRLLDHIESKRQLLRLFQQAHEPNRLNVEETTDLLNRYVGELDSVLREHGLTVQLLQPASL